MRFSSVLLPVFDRDIVEPLCHFCTFFRWNPSLERESISRRENVFSLKSGVIEPLFAMYFAPITGNSS